MYVYLNMALVRRIVAPLQRRTVVIAFRIARFVGGVRSTPQAGLAGVFVVEHFVLVFDRRQPRLDFVKLGRGYDILLLGRENLSNLLLRLLDPVWSLRVGVEGL